MTHHPLEVLINNYLSELDITRRSRDLYDTVLKQYLYYLIEHDIQSPGTTDVMQYLDWKKSQNYSTSWMYHQIGIVKGLYKYLSINQERLGLSEIYKVDITENIKNVRNNNQIAKPVFSIEQAKHLILCTKNARKYIWHYRDYAMIYLMMTTGLRSVEIRRARKKDLRLFNGYTVLYVQGKGRASSDAFVKITDGVNKALTEYLNKRKDSNPYLFISHSKRSLKPALSRTFFLGMFRRVLKSCDLDHLGLTPHSLRHSAATFNLQRGGSLESTRQMMRHSSVSSTLIYAHHINRLKDDSENQIEDYILNKNHKKA